jgi:anti-sigma B factor antagonist
VQSHEGEKYDMEISVKTEGGICIATVSEARIDAAVALAFKEQMRKATEDVEPVVILNLEQVNFIDSSGLGALVATLKYLTPEHELILSGMTPAVAQVFELTRMDKVFRMYPSRVEAQRALAS